MCLAFWAIEPGFSDRRTNPCLRGLNGGSDEREAEKMSQARVWMLAAALGAAGPALAVDFGVMESADVVAPRDFKFIAYPLGVREGARREQASGVGLGLGYGLARETDIELQVAAYDDVTY